MSMHSPSRSSRTSYLHTLAAIVLLLGLGLRPAAAATIVLTSNRSISGVIDEAASDASQLVVKTAEAVVKIPRGKILRIDQDSAPAGQTEQDALKQAESALASDPNNAALRQKVEGLRQTIQSRERLNYKGFFDKLDVLIQNQKFEEAISEADGIIARISDDGARAQFKRLKAQAHIGQAHVCREHVNYTEEERNYKAAMEADPESPVAPLELADLLYQTSPARGAEACSLYEKGLALAQAKPGAIQADQAIDYEFKLGELYLNEKQFVLAGDKFLAVMLKDANFRHATADDMAVNAYGRLPLADLSDTTRTHIIESVRALLNKKPGKEQAYLLLGRIFFDQKQWTDARDNLLLAVRNDSGANNQVLQESLYNLSIALRRLHQDQEAVQYLNRLLGLKPNHYDALCELGDIVMGAGSATEAQDLFEKALKIDADKYRAYLGQGSALQAQGKFDDARKSFQKVLDHEEKNAPAQLAIARSYFAEKKYDETVTEAAKALDFVRGHYKKEGDATSQTQAAPAAPVAPVAPVAMPVAPTSGTLAAAGATTGTVVAAAPAPAAAAPAVQAGGAEDEAILPKITPEDAALMAEGYTLIGTAYTATQKTNQARDNFNAALKFDAKYAAAFAGLGASYAADKLDPQAVENFQKAIALEPQNPEYYLSFAIYWHKDQKAPEKALPLYQKYQELGGKDPQVAAAIKECSAKPKS